MKTDPLSIEKAGNRSFKTVRRRSNRDSDLTVLVATWLLSRAFVTPVVLALPTDECRLFLPH